MRHFICCIGCLVLASPALATTWHVAVTGHDSNDGSQSSPWATIQHAIHQSSGGDTIFIAEGTYSEHEIDPFGKEITITGPDISTYGWPPVVIIDGEKQGSVLRCDSGEDSLTVFKNLYIGNGHAENGGGFFCNNGSRPVLENMKFKYNTATHHGGGMFISGGDITPDGGPTLTNVEFHTNHAVSGGAIYCRNSNPVISGPEHDTGTSRFYSNQATGNGGALYFVNSHGSVTGYSFHNNQATIWGGGIYFEDTSSTTLNYCNISFNTATSGGGIGSIQSHPVLNNCDLLHNTASLDGGGIFCKQTHLSVNSTTIEHNTALHGGGIYHDGSSAPVINNSTIMSNTPSGATNSMVAVRGSGFGEGTLMDTVICSNTTNQVMGNWNHAGGNSINDTCSGPAGDMDGDGDIDAIDVHLVEHAAGICHHDTNGDGITNILDLLDVIIGWGASCAP